MSAPENHLGLLVVDMQDSFLKAIHHGQQLRYRTTFAVEAARLLGIRVAATEQLPAKLGPRNAVLAEAWGADTPVFEKSAFSALAADGVERWIESNQLDHLLLAGIESSICIYQSALDALGRDLGVTLLDDCIGERRPEDRPAVLRQLIAVDAHVLPSETIFYSLLGDATDPRFKEFTGLVKRYDSTTSNR